ncbi:MAG TPA: hypothetical protein VM328_09905 [Fimbriimonadaceae bacterium]|nr:hypothetical protein [Fimbriimonadaceae bacterium]
MNSDFYRKLVDLYAARELTEELDEMMDAQAYNDPELAAEMHSLRDTVDLLRAQPPVEYTEETHQRILMKLYARGAQPEMTAPEPAHLQYHLPIQS